MFSLISLLLSMFCLFAVSFTSVLFHSSSFPFSLYFFSALQCSALSYPFSLSHFLHLQVPRQGAEVHRKHCSYIAKLLPRHQFSDASFTIGLSLPPSLSFSLSSGLVLSSLLSLSLPLTSGINRARLIPTFSRIMSASVVTQQRERQGKRGRERTCEYVTDIFACFYLRCSLSPK